MRKRRDDSAREFVPECTISLVDLQRDLDGNRSAHDRLAQEKRDLDLSTIETREIKLKDLNRSLHFDDQSIHFHHSVNEYFPPRNFEEMKELKQENKIAEPITPNAIMLDNSFR